MSLDHILLTTALDQLQNQVWSNPIKISIMRPQFYDSLPIAHQPFPDGSSQASVEEVLLSNQLMQRGKFILSLNYWISFFRNNLFFFFKDISYQPTASILECSSSSSQSEDCTVHNLTGQKNSNKDSLCLYIYLEFIIKLTNFLSSFRIGFGQYRCRWNSRFLARWEGWNCQ